MWHRLLIYPVLFLLSAALLTIFPNSDIFAQCSTVDRADGLVSAPGSIVKFGNQGGICVNDPATTFATYEIPTYSEFKNLYYDLPRTLPPSAQFGYSYKAPHTPSAGTADQSYFNSGPGAITGNSVYYIDGNLTLNAMPTMPIATTLIVFIERDLNINTRINYSDNSGGFVFVVRGNINISYNVDLINAILISSGDKVVGTTNYSICTANEADGTCPSAYRRVTSPLVVNGTMASICARPTKCADADLRPIRFRRALVSNANNPAEIINFDAKYLVTLKDSFSLSKKIQTEIADYAGSTTFQPNNVPIASTSYVCQDQCTATTLVTGMTRDSSGFCNTTSGISRTCPSSTYNGQSITCGGRSYLCSNGWTLNPNCTATPSCAAACSAIGNSCAVNGGTRTCNYTTLPNGSTNCTPTAAPNQPCTYTCPGNTSCVSGQCVAITLSGTVALQGGGGYPNATLNLTGPVTRSVRTDASGQFRFDGLTSGNYTVTLVAPSGHRITSTNPVNVVVSADATANFTIAPN